MGAFSLRSDFIAKTAGTGYNIFLWFAICKRVGEGNLVGTITK